ncbi:hypothetical protein COB52_02670 [Candidatus Kaiserbacteria bacterium]|nr:MAG: hypothetical protein COB52_02670 [Candidatus Kaiserbacteria bacterium]
METATAVGDGKLTNEDLGTLTRRLIDIIRRVNEGTIEKRDVLTAFQRLAEGKAKEMVEPCPRTHRRDPVKFKMLPIKERRKSRAPLRMRTPQFLNRLYFRYRASFSSHKIYGDRYLMHEDIIALMWEAENIPRPAVNHGWTPVLTILDDRNASKHDREIVASTLQWLGTNVGREFLGRLVATADIQI